MYEADIGEAEHILLLYSGGLDTSAMLVWLQDKYGASVSTLTVDLGQGEDLAAVKEKALALGAKEALVVDAKKKFLEEFIVPSIRANGLYMGKYPMATALGRPLMVQEAVKAAGEMGADALAHGCTGKGNDQVRLEAAILVLDPSLKVVAPVRKFKLSRAREKAILEERGIEVPGNHDHYSVDENLWGLSFQGSELADPANRPDSRVHESIKCYFPSWNCPAEAPEEPAFVTIGFEDGLPVSLDGEELELGQIVNKLNALGAKHGVGVIDYVESYIFGHKGREFYVAPAATVLLEAHKELEHLLMQKQQLAHKQLADAKWSYFAYHGLWFHKLMGDLASLEESANQGLDGKVELKLYKGSATMVSRSSPGATPYLYGEGLGEKGFDEGASPGFIELFSLEMRV